MEFENENGTANTWWAGMVTQYNPTNDQYAAFSHGQVTILQGR